MRCNRPSRRSRWGSVSSLSAVTLAIALSTGASSMAAGQDGPMRATAGAAASTRARTTIPGRRGHDIIGLEVLFDELERAYRLPIIVLVGDEVVLVYPHEDRAWLLIVVVGRREDIGDAL